MSKLKKGLVEAGSAQVTGRRLGRATTGLAIGSALVLSACGGSGGTGSGDGTVTYTFSSAQPPSSNFSQGFAAYMDRVTELTDGRVQWEQQYAGALLPSSESGVGVGDGRADFGFFVPAYDPTTFPLYNIGYVPAAAGLELDMISYVNAHYDFFTTNEQILAEFDRANVRMLLVQGASNVATVGIKEPVDTVEDLQGSSIRVVGPAAAMLEEVGIEPAAIAVEDLYESFERGVVDLVGGYDMTTYVAQSLHEIAPWIQQLPMPPFATVSVIVNEDVWAEMDDDIKSAFEQANEEYYAELAENMTEAETAACDALIEAGGGVRPLDPNTELGQALHGDEVLEAAYAVWRSQAAGAGASEDDIAAVESEYKSVMSSAVPTEGYSDGPAACAARTP